MRPLSTSIDLSSYPEPGTDEYNCLTFDEISKLDEFHTFTAEVTSVEPGVSILSMINCEEILDDGDLCFGPIELVRYQVPSEIRWECLECGQKGAITGFEDINSDLSKLSPEEASIILFERYGDEPIDFDLMDEEFNDLGISPDDEEEFVNWFVNVGTEDKGLIMNQMGIDIDQINREFGQSAGGLEQASLYNLLVCDWDDPKAPLQLNRNLKPDEIERTFFFHNARIFLIKAQRDGIGLTKNGNLKQKEILELIDEGIWPDGYIDRIKEYNKVINEYDIWLLHTLRIMLEISGLVRKSKDKLVGVKKRAVITEIEKAGELFSLLFVSYFRMMNIAYLTNSYQDYKYVQESVPYTLFRLQQLAAKWISSDELAEKTLLITAQQELLDSLKFEFQTKGNEFYDLILKPLELFGVIESKLTEKTDKWHPRPDRFRKTPLFDKFITVRFPTKFDV